jgi:alkylation response protein AidB-like acyl-CoA dehydrogenase
MTVGEPIGLLGLRALPCADVTFKGAEILLAERAETSRLIYVLGVLSLFTSACASAAAMEAMERAWSYAGERYQGGRMIEQYDAIRLMYAKNRACVESAVTRLLEDAQSFQGDDEDSWVLPLRSKASASEAAVNAVLDSVQMLGGYGYMRDYGIEKRLRDTVALSLLPLDSTRSCLLSQIMLRP